MSTISNTISLARYTQRIYDQGSQGSCKANQIVGAVELQAQMYGANYHLSRQQLYNDTREIMGTFSTDSGSNITAANMAATGNGIANESDFSYGAHNLYVHTNAAVDASAASQKVFGITSLSPYVTSDELSLTIGEQLMQGKPVLIDAYIHSNFGMPSYDITKPNVGAHAYLIVGVDYTAKTYTVQNSWGATWANGGYGAIKFSDIPGYGANTPTNQDLMRASVLNGFDGIDLTWTDLREEVAMLYAGLFERCAERDGVMYWAGLMSNGLANERGVANMLFNSAEAQQKYGAMNNTEFVSELYGNAMGRAGDAGGIAYWSSVLDSGYGRGDLAYDFLHLVDIGQDTQAANDRLENMETVSMNYGITYQLGDAHQANGVYALSQVTSNADNLPLILVGLHDAAYGAPDA